MAKMIVKPSHSPKQVNLNTISVSVIMSVYNSSEYLNEAIQSILSQTFTDFEFIIINDCSTDDSLEIIKSIKDDRIHIINNEKNIGLAASLNKALVIAKGEYIVRMDADDIAKRKRIEIQVKFMNKYPDYGVAGSYFRFIGTISWYHRLQIIKGFKKNEDIKSLLLFGTALLHPSVIIRKNVLTSNNIYYNESFYRAQDYELWSRLVFLTNITNIPRVLIKWRISQNQSSIKDKDVQIKFSRKIQFEILKKILGYEPTEKQIETHSKIISNQKYSKNNLLEIENWLILLVSSAEKNINFNKKSVLNQCSQIFFNVCLRSEYDFLSKTLIYYKSPLFLIRSISLKSFLSYILFYKK